MFDIVLCIVALLLVIYGTEKIFTYFYKNPYPERLQLLLGGLLVLSSGAILPFTSISAGLYTLWSLYSLIVGYSVIVYDYVMRK